MAWLSFEAPRLDWSWRTAGKLSRGAARTVVACAVSYAASVLLHLPQPYWAMITALAILQGSALQTLNAGRDQTLGAIIGALVGVAAIGVTLLCGHRLLIFFAALLPLAMATAWLPSLRLACVTMIIVVLAPSDANLFARALDRVIEIGVGVAGGVLVAYVLFRSRARRTAYERGGDVLDEMAAQIRRVLSVDAQGGRDGTAIEAGHDGIARALDAASAASREALREGGSPAPHSTRFAMRMVAILRRLQSDIMFVDHATGSLPDDTSPDGGPGQAFGCRPGQAAMRQAGDRMGDLLAALAAMVTADQPQARRQAVIDAQAGLDTAIGALDRDRSMTLRFVLGLVGRDLGDLATLLRDDEDEGAAGHPRAR